MVRVSLPNVGWRARGLAFEGCYIAWMRVLSGMSWGSVFDDVWRRVGEGAIGTLHVDERLFVRVAVQRGRHNDASAEVPCSIGAGDVHMMGDNRATGRAVGGPIFREARERISGVLVRMLLPVGVVLVDAVGLRIILGLQRRVEL